jgi:hypothetical protein
MRTLLLLVVFLACPALASRELSNRYWRSLDAVVRTDLFGDVAIRCQADDRGFVQSAEVRTQDAAVVVPANWMAKLPRVLLSTPDVRTELGRTRVPSLYLVFRDGPSDHKGTTQLHIVIQQGKLKEAMITFWHTDDENSATFVDAP